MFTHEHFYINTSHLNHSKSSVNSGKDNSVPTQSEKLMRGKKKHTLPGGSSDEGSLLLL